LWTANTGFYSHVPTDLPEVRVVVAYLFYEKGDVPNELFNLRLSSSLSIALVVVGFCPSETTLLAIAECFPNARFRTAFGKDLPARVLACRICLWIKKRDASFWLVLGRIHFRYLSKEFSCPEEVFSVNRFCRITGFRTTLSVYI